MSEKPIIFSAESMRAILAGKKTQTRRVIKPQPEWIQTDPKLVLPYWQWNSRSLKFCCGYTVRGAMARQMANHAPYQPGDLLWVRETWARIWPDAHPAPIEQCTIEYRADHPNALYPGNWPPEEAKGNPDAPKWRSARYMPKVASRCRLTLCSVRAEPLQDITTYDALAEGIEVSHYYCEEPTADSAGIHHCDPIGKFAQVWNQIHSPNWRVQWDANPLVWVLSWNA